jgi:excisionase family DNA binding protein
MAGRYAHNPDPQLAELLHQVSLDGWANDSTGDVTQDSVHASLLIVEPAEQQELTYAFDQAIPPGNWVLVEDEQGFVTLDEYPSAQAARHAFTHLQDNWAGPGEEDGTITPPGRLGSPYGVALAGRFLGYATDLEQAKAMLRAARIPTGTGRMPGSSATTATPTASTSPNHDQRQHPAAVTAGPAGRNPYLRRHADSAPDAGNPAPAIQQPPQEGRMSSASRQNTPAPNAGSRYRPTPAPPGGADRPASAATGREAPPWPTTHPTGHQELHTRTPPLAESAGPGDPLAQLPEVLKVREAAAILRVGRNQLYAAIARGELPAVRIGRTIRIPTAALTDLLTNRPELVASSAASE